METEKKDKEKLLEIAYKIIDAAHARILLDLRFLEVAMGNLSWEPAFGSSSYACDGKKIYFDPKKLVEDFKLDQESVVNLYLHEIFHLVFHHNFEYEKKNEKAWDLASDVAVWTVMMELDTYKDKSEADAERRLKLKTLRKRCPQLSAVKLYKLFLVEPPSYLEEATLRRLFCTDSHVLWKEPEKYEISLEQWKKITERIKADLKSFSKNKAGGESLDLELAEATREKQDYGKFLKQFMMQGEAMHINDEEFDYVYYTYGLETYGNMPLVEPLEYKDINRINEFVIALDTSASCKDELVQRFLNETAAMLLTEENFFRKINIRIIECDDQVQREEIITSVDDMKKFAKGIHVEGGYGTDFRPVFTRVSKLIDSHEFENLKGLIYFTDGFGIYPDKPTSYDTAFIFPQDEEYDDEKVPDWALKLYI